MPSRTTLVGAVICLAVSLAASCAQPQRGGAGRDAGSSNGAQRAQVSGSSDAGRDPCDALDPAQRALVVARVGNSTLTLCDFARRIASQNQYLRARFNNPEQRRALLRAWVDSELLAAEARARGLDNEPQVRHAITSQLARQLTMELRASVPMPTVRDEDIAAYYEAHRAEYDTPEQVRASHIVLRDRATAERVLADARAHASDEAYWRELVRRESLDGATREIGGDLGYFAVQGGTTVPREVASAAFALRSIGEIAAQVVESAHGGPGAGPGFHVVRLTARRPALHRSLEEVRQPIRNRLVRERFEAAQQRAVDELVARLRSQTPVSIDESALAQVRLDVQPGVVPAMPGRPPGAAPVPPVPVPAAGAPR